MLRWLHNGGGFHRLCFDGVVMDLSWSVVGGCDGFVMWW
jgi:hypothetical protein